MVKREIDICDICKKTVAERKCEFCNADLCAQCKTHFGIGTEDKLMFAIISCPNCNEILQSSSLEQEFKNCPNVREELIEIFRKIIQLEELEGKVKKKKKKDDAEYIKQYYPGMGCYPYPNRLYTATSPQKRTGGFAWAASKAGKLKRYNYNNDDEDDKA